MGFYIGVDGGGSKTAAVLIDGSAKVLGEGRSGPSNHLRVGVPEAAANIRNAIRQVAESAGVKIADVAFAYCGLAGSDHPAHRGGMVEALLPLFPRSNFTIDSDTRCALTGAIGFGAGVVVISGTGSVAFGRNGKGREARAGGWGPTIGDEGSGYSIGRRGLAAIVRAYDGRGPRTIMTQILCNSYAKCDPEELPYFVYAPTTRADDIARYCLMVIEAAREGDAVAHAIFESEGYELGKTVVAVSRKLELDDEPFAVSYIGGAFTAGDLLMRPMSEVIHAGFPRATIHPPKESPVMGAARLAMRSGQQKPRIR
ncbi:MAG TPA: BadF/BadG/BcrA/BcrD ATPase family protein [Thermoanaerobaculia bacterium]|nr:BadF/BadG/BcrA/BcrD ATPase family protein [Thermoanaerobaculia bacterium]